MEHRCAERIAMALPVTVRSARHPSAPGTIRDLSCGGAFIALPAGFGPFNGCIEVQVSLPFAEPRNCRWRAYVVHSQTDGIGVMFDERNLGDLLPLICAETAARRLRQAPARSRGKTGILVT
jgi:hypothetical protein